jgi:predicted dinucleotide-binding enzyme
MSTHKKIAILGTGQVGSALGKNLAKAGHEVVYGSRTKGMSYKDAARDAEVVILATPFSAAKETLEATGSLDGKVLIDATNPLTPDFMGITIGFNTSAGEQVQSWTRAKVVKAFSTVFVQLLADPKGETVFVASDDEDAKRMVLGLAEQIGFEPIDGGKLLNARYLEPMAEMLLQLGYGLGNGPRIALKLTRR